ncbi:hypothetical protein [Albibacillus kandeliae]|uniref:hypothetical protein n=1 Tax=Albibacillus kandeliae TaxID=2174228 RepID=UPI000D693B12|nr:hypothetical protein [Albibacillus kandeliae]
MTKKGFFSGFDVDPAEMARRLRDSLSPRDHAMNLLLHTLLDQQLDAIKRTLRNHEEAREAEAYRLDVLDTDPSWGGDHDGGLDSLRDERFWRMTFQASAHSMAAVGMLAPFIESLFVELFEGLKTRTEIKSDHPRIALKSNKRWKPQFYAEYGKEMRGFAMGAVQLSEAIDLLPFLPHELSKSLSALNKYRNNMFHNGFEWPEATIANFDEERSNWPETWFELAHRSGKPWLFYMTPAFCAHCVTLIEGIINGTGQYLKERGL